MYHRGYDVWRVSVCFTRGFDLEWATICLSFEATQRSGRDLLRASACEWSHTSWEVRFVAGIGMCMFCDRATKGVRICWKTLKNTIYYGHRCVHVVKFQITGILDLLRIYAAKYYITNTIRYNHRHENIVRGEARLISQPLSAMMCTHANSRGNSPPKFHARLQRCP